MPEPLETGQAQRRQCLGLLPPGGGQRREVAVGEGWNYDVGRRLAEIDGDIGFLQRRELGRENVHALPAYKFLWLPISVIPTGAERSEAKWRDLFCRSADKNRSLDYAALRAA